jgi:iron complex outermembrane recepter protein
MKRELMKRKINLAMVALFACTVTYAKDNTEIELQSVDIDGSRLNYFDNLGGNEQTRTIDGETISTLMGTTSTNYYKSLQLLPSVNTETHDPYALTADQNILRVRGQLGDTFSRLSSTIEGIPFGVNVGNGGTGYLLDKENITAVDFTTGITPSNKGLGFGTTSGSLNLQLVKPKQQLGGTISLGGGTDSYKKVFVRFDSGKIDDTFNFFISTSTMKNDKWKGEGDITRKNVEAMGVIDLSNTTNIELFGSYNVFDRYEYAPLTYLETQALDSNYNKDYNTNITGNKFADAYYYDFYKQDFDEYFYYTALNTQIEDLKIKFKPYTYGSEGTRYMGDSSKGIVKKMLIDQESYGADLSFEYPFYAGNLYGGWWYQEIETTPPPKMMQVYAIQSDGSLKYVSTGMLNDIEKRISNSPYVGYEKTLEKTHFNVGLRYLMFDFPAVTGYNTAGLSESSYEDAMNVTSGEKNGMKVDESSSNILLPSLMVDYKLDQNWKIGGGYAKNYANPWQGPLWSVYNSNVAVFQAAGISLQNLWDELKLETSDNIELFTQYTNKNFTIKNTLFYGKYKNKQVTVYDPTLNLSYYKSDAKSRSMGMELEGSYSFSQKVSLFASMYYNKFEFDDDILLATNSYLNTKGNQIPDVAKVGAKLGVNFDFGNWSITPTARYVGKRYGDAENTEEVDPYTVFDISSKYTVKKDVLEFSLSLQNIFDKKYIGVVKNSLDDTRTGSTSYYQGAPFSAVLNIVYKF